MDNRKPKYIKMEYCVYCDESCHLEHDNIKPIVLELYGVLNQKRIKYLNASGK